MGSGFHKMISGWKTFTSKDPDMLEDTDSFRLTFPLGNVREGLYETTQKTTQKILGLVVYTKL